MKPFTFRRSGKTISLATSSSRLGALRWLSWDAESTQAYLCLSWARSLPALLGELVTNGAFTPLSRRWVCLEQKRGGFMLLWWPATWLEARRGQPGYHWASTYRATMPCSGIFWPGWLAFCWWMKMASKTKLYLFLPFPPALFFDQWTRCKWTSWLAV